MMKQKNLLFGAVIMALGLSLFIALRSVREENRHVPKTKAPTHHGCSCKHHHHHDKA